MIIVEMDSCPCCGSIPIDDPVPRLPHEMSVPDGMYRFETQGGFIDVVVPVNGDHIPI